MSTPQQSPTATESKKTKFGPGMPVPALSLEKAVGLAGKLWAAEKRNAAPVTSVMTHWGYGTKSSGGFQAIAALKRYGLLAEEGSNEKRTLQLSPLAIELLKNATLDLQAYYKLLKQAALHPKAHQELWQKYGVDLPSDATLRSFLVFDKHFTEEAARQFVQVYKDTLSFAKLGEGDGIPDENKMPEDEESDLPLYVPPPASVPPVTSNLPTVTPSPASTPLQLQPPAPIRQQDPTVKYLTIPTDAGDAMIPMGMSEEDFELFKGALELFRKKIVRQ